MSAECASFADWQFSRGIVPWVVVHDFSDAYFLRWQLDVRCRAVIRRNAEPVLDAFRGLADAAAMVVSSCVDLADALALSGETTT